MQNKMFLTYKHTQRKRSNNKSELDYVRING